MELLLFIFVIAFIGIAANTVGVDSRDGSSDPRRQVYPVGIN
jgi:hypothetical protein